MGYNHGVLHTFKYGQDHFSSIIYVYCILSFMILFVSCTPSIVVQSTALKRSVIVNWVDKHVLMDPNMFTRPE